MMDLTLNDWVKDSSKEKEISECGTEYFLIVSRMDMAKNGCRRKGKKWKKLEGK